MPRENMAPSPEDVPGSSVATREHTLRSDMARAAPGEVASQKIGLLDIMRAGGIGQKYFRKHSLS